MTPLSSLSGDFKKSFKNFMSPLSGENKTFNEIISKF